MTCPICGKPQLRRHRHGEGLSIRYGKWAAEQERARIRLFLQQARKRMTPV